MEKYGYKVSLIVTTVFFVISHNVNSVMIDVALFGVLSFYLASKYSVKYSIILHILYNTYVIVQRNILSMEENSLKNYLIGIFAIINILSIISGIYYSIKGGVSKYFSLLRLGEEDRRNFMLFIKENKGSIVIISLLFIIGILF